MSCLVDDVLGLARLDQHPERQRDPVDIIAVVHDCVGRARIADPARTWRADAEAGLITVGDREMLSRAVDNLLANVRAHTPEGTAHARLNHPHGLCVALTMPAAERRSGPPRQTRDGPLVAGSGPAGL
jgi:two-component system, OmpR family, sensor kinase